jgi:A/G-specific adenine glycosylase
VRHTFTHFHLHLRVLVAQSDGNPNRGQFTELNPKDLPTLMAKAYHAATKEGKNV